MTRPPDLDAHDGFDVLEAEEDAQAAVFVGLWTSATRCVLTYVVAPILGSAGMWVPWIGLFLQLLGCVVTVAGVVRIWSTRHRARVLFAGIGMLVVTTTAWAVVHV